MPAKAEGVTTVPSGRGEGLEAERAWLRHARGCLRQMYDDARSITPQGGNETATLALEALLARRVASLRLDPGTPLFFGRLDYDEGGERHAGERHYVGRRHVRDGHGDPVVLDWRAPLCEDFYQASGSDPRGLWRRRRFGFSGGELSAYEDDVISLAPSGVLSDLVIAEIERPRFGAMSDIVATIQPDQDHVVRADLRTTICVQGGPGTGKTAVGLHRAAFLLYREADQLSRAKVLVVGPNDLFLDYIGQVLPALGEVEVEHQTVERLIGGVPVRATDAPETARLKGDARMADVLAAAVGVGVTAPRSPLLVAVNGRSWRVPLDELEKIVTDLTARQLRYETSRRALAGMIGLSLARRIGADDSLVSDKLAERLARSREVRAWVDAVRPKVEPVRLVARLLSEPDFLAAAADGILTADEQAAIGWAVPPRRLASAPWTLADAVLVDEVVGLLERPRSYGHVVVDEAQDLSAMQCRAIGRRCATSSATLLGDFAQATTSAALSGWAETLRHMGKQQGLVEVLTTSYRVPGRILEFANRLVPYLDADVAPVVAGRRHAGGLRVVPCPSGELLGRAAELALEATGRPGSIGVIVPDALADEMSAALHAHGPRDGSPAGRISVTAVGLVKGLEFDTTIVVEPARIAGAERHGLRRLYVALTRAVSEMTVLHAEPLPSALGPA